MKWCIDIAQYDYSETEGRAGVRLKTTVAIWLELLAPFLPAQTPPCTECGTRYQKQGKSAQRDSHKHGSVEIKARQCRTSTAVRNKARQCRTRRTAVQNMERTAVQKLSARQCGTDSARQCGTSNARQCETPARQC